VRIAANLALLLAACAGPTVAVEIVPEPFDPPGATRGEPVVAYNEGAEAERLRLLDLEESRAAAGRSNRLRRIEIVNAERERDEGARRGPGTATRRRVVRRVPSLRSPRPSHPGDARPYTGGGLISLLARHP
jgi:hypothetical protein